MDAHACTPSSDLRMGPNEIGLNEDIASPGMTSIAVCKTVSMMVGSVHCARSSVPLCQWRATAFKLDKR